MHKNDLKLYGEMLREIRKILQNKDRLGIVNLPLEFDGVINDLLYDTGVHNEALVLFVSELIQEAVGAPEGEIVSRFQLCERVLSAIYDRNKQQP